MTFSGLRISEKNSVAAYSVPFKTMRNVVKTDDWSSATCSVLNLVTLARSCGHILWHVYVFVGLILTQQPNEAREPGDCSGSCALSLVNGVGM